MIDWRIYYSDGDTFSSDEGDPGDAPGWSAQIVLVKDEEVGRRLICMSDYYIYHDAAWLGVDFVGLMDHLVNELCIVKVGRMITKSQWRDLHDLAIADKDFPQKSARDQREKRPK